MIVSMVKKQQCGKIGNIDMRLVQSSTASASATATDVVYNDEWISVLALQAVEHKSINKSEKFLLCNYSV